MLKQGISGYNFAKSIPLKPVFAVNPEEN